MPCQIVLAHGAGDGGAVRVGSGVDRNIFEQTFVCAHGNRSPLMIDGCIIAGFGGKSKSPPAGETRAAFGRWSYERDSLSQPHHIHRGDEQRQGHAAEQGGDDGRRGRRSCPPAYRYRKACCNLPAIGMAATITQMPASMRLIGHDQRRAPIKTSGMTIRRSSAHAVQARLGERGADIAVRQRGADDHHRHRRIDGADGGQRAFHRARAAASRSGRRAARSARKPRRG